eukprot:3603139-Pyramimonas_sp.AAC.1
MLCFWPPRLFELPALYDCQRAPQKPPSDGPGVPQKGTQMAQDGAKTAPEAPRTAQECPKTTPRKAQEGDPNAKSESS